MRARLTVSVLLLSMLLASGCATARRYRYQPHLTAPGADILAALTIAGGNEAVDGNTAVPLENGDEAFPQMLEAIRGATDHVHLEMYIFRDGAIAREFVAALAERARAGVRVRLLLDAFGSLGFGAENQRVLEEAGAQVVFFRPLRLGNLLRVHLRTHRKILIVDGRVGFTGGICIDDAWTGDATREDHWRETQVRVEGPVVRQMQAAFARSWLEANGEILSSETLYPRLPLPGHLSCQVMDSTPGYHGNPARLSFLVAVSSARESIAITTAYMVLDDVALDALIAAAKRGVRVRIVLPSRNTDAKPVRYAGRISYRKMLEAGIALYEFQPARLHAKTIVVDGRWTSIGSTNLDRRSFFWNYESNVNVFDPAFAQRMTEMFERDIARSQHITLEEWKRRPLSEKILEQLYGLLRSQY